MSEVTRDDIRSMLSDQTKAVTAVVELRLAPIEEHLARHDAVLDSHTVILDRIAKNTEHWRTEAAALKAGYDRHDGWLHQIARKLGMKFD